MLTFLKKLLWDEAAFERYSRAVFCTLGLTLVAIGKVPETKKEWFGLLFVFIALLTGAGDKNRRPVVGAGGTESPVESRATETQQRRENLLGDRAP